MPERVSGSNRKKILIYAGVAGAVLAVLMLVKKRSSTTSETPPEGATTYTTAPAGIPAGSAESAGATQQELAAFGESLRQQLPAAIESGVKAGLANNTTSSPGSNSLAEILGALGAYQGTILANSTGQQTGPSTPSPSQAAPPAQEAPHPAAPPPAPPAPAPKPSPPTFTIIRCGNGCQGHRYRDGHTECQVKNSKGQCYWP